MLFNVNEHQTSQNNKVTFQMSLSVTRLVTSVKMNLVSILVASSPIAKLQFITPLLLHTYLGMSPR